MRRAFWQSFALRHPPRLTGASSRRTQPRLEPESSSLRRATSDVVVAVGGDGTVAETLTAIGNVPTPLAILPGGSTNVIAHEIGAPINPTEVGNLDLRPSRNPNHGRCHVQRAYVPAYGRRWVRQPNLRSDQCRPEATGRLDCLFAWRRQEPADAAGPVPRPNR